jgi:hypothetical protein
MNIYEKLGEALNVELTDDYKLNATDLEISTWNTADGYEVHIMTEDPRELNWEYDVYYYEPSFDEVIARIKELPEGSTVYLCDYEQYLPEYEVKDWLAEHYDDEDEEDEEEDNRSTVEILQDLSNYTRHDG